MFLLQIHLPLWKVNLSTLLFTIQQKHWRKTSSTSSFTVRRVYQFCNLWIILTLLNKTKIVFESCLGCFIFTVKHSIWCHYSCSWSLSSFSEGWPTFDSSLRAFTQNCLNLKTYFFHSGLPFPFPCFQGAQS